MSPLKTKKRMAYAASSVFRFQSLRHGVNTLRVKGEEVAGTEGKVTQETVWLQVWRGTSRADSKRMPGATGDPVECSRTMLLLLFTYGFHLISVAYVGFTIYTTQ